MINWLNPYDRLSDTWFKGNLHAHTSPASPCGRVRLERVIELYEKAGFDFLSISDHQQYTKVYVPTSLCIIPGIEWNSRNKMQDRMVVNYENHLGFYNLEITRLESTTIYHTPMEAIASVVEPGTLVVINHPNWLVPHHYSEERLFELAPVADGVEIYNAVIDRHPGSADATMKWDRMLSEKGPILGFASDDSHLEGDIGKACIVVNAEEKSSQTIFSGIKAGRFYCSTGVLIDKIGRDSDEIYCASGTDVFIEASGKNGEVFASAYQQLRVDLADTPSSYLRFTLYGPGKQQAWSQPFFVTKQL